jgi:iron(III) transport system substrate-binding protein
LPEGIEAVSVRSVAEAVEKAMAAEDLSRVAIAKPLYGTTLTHYSVLWREWGGEKLKSWHEDVRRRGIVEATGNAHVKNLVAEGDCDLGLTDTDDFFVAKDEGRPVAMLPFRLEDGRVICMPNTVAITSDRSVEAARALADYLLSRHAELAMARSASRQIPLGRVGEDSARADFGELGPAVEPPDLPEEVRQLARATANAYPLAEAASARADCLSWLRTEYLE